MEKKGGYVNSYDTNTGYNSNTGYNTENGYRTNYTNQQTVYYSNQQQYPVVHATSPPQQPSDPRDVERAAKRVAAFSLIGTILGIVLIALGAATLGVAAENIGFPVFNFGPLITGLLVTIGYGCAYFNIRQVTSYATYEPDTLHTRKCPLVTVFVISVVTTTFASMSGIFAFLSGATCAGSGIQWYSGRGSNRTPIDTYQYCFPNDKANTALAFCDGVVCVVLVIYAIVGCVFFCLYGRYFGVRNRRVTYY